jgi:hypothetical protein
VAKAVAAAVSPDNLKTPENMIVATVLNGKVVTTELALEGKITTLTATIDDLLSCVSVAEKTLKTLRYPNCRKIKSAMTIS